MFENMISCSANRQRSSSISPPATIPKCSPTTSPPTVVRYEDGVKTEAAKLFGSPDANCVSKPNGETVMLVEMIKALQHTLHRLDETEFKLNQRVAHLLQENINEMAASDNTPSCQSKSDNEYLMTKVEQLEQRVAQLENAVNVVPQETPQKSVHLVDPSQFSNVDISASSSNSVRYSELTTSMLIEAAEGELQRAGYAPTTTAHHRR